MVRLKTPQRAMVCQPIHVTSISHTCVFFYRYIGNKVSEAEADLEELIFLTLLEDSQGLLEGGAGKVCINISKFAVRDDHNVVSYAATECRTFLLYYLPMLRGIFT